MHFCIPSEDESVAAGGKKRELLPHDFKRPFPGLHFFFSFSIITGDNPFCACGANSQFGDFPLRENKEGGGGRRRCWWWECGRGCFHPPPPLPPPPMRWALSSFPPPRLLQAEYGCSGIPWRHETVAVETTVTKTGRHLLIPRGPPISYIGWLEQRQFRAERGRLEFSLRVWCHIKKPNGS